MQSIHKAVLLTLLVLLLSSCEVLVAIGHQVLEEKRFLAGSEVVKMLF